VASTLYRKGDDLGEIRGRFAPSPTGEMHLGNAWTALLAWLDVRKHNGTMVLRMEDLDPDRSRPEYAEGIMHDLAWLGLDWDEGPDTGGAYAPYVQDERRELYQRMLERLIEADLVYPCYCSRAEIQTAASAPHGGEGEAAYPGTCRSRRGGCKNRKPALRIKVPNKVISFEDGVYGRIDENLAQTAGDFIVRRSDGVHAYQLAVVVDDALMQISRVLRGDDLLSSTSRQLLLYELLGFAPPSFTHVPLLYGEDGHRLSKRQRPLALAEMREKYMSAEKLIGYLAWKAGLVDCWQAVRPEELIDGFSLEKLTREAVVVRYQDFS